MSEPALSSSRCEASVTWLCCLQGPAAAPYTAACQAGCHARYGTHLAEEQPNMAALLKRITKVFDTINPFEGNTIN